MAGLEYDTMQAEGEEMFNGNPVVFGPYSR